jgi:hypothetical protein
MHEGEGNQGPASKVFTHEAVDGFSILEPAQQGREAFGLMVQGKHGLVNDCKSGAARLSQCLGLGDPILEYSQLPSFRAISPKVIGDRIGVRLSRTKMRIYMASLSFTIKTHICIQQNEMIRRCQPEEELIKDTTNLCSIALPRFSISPRRNLSASAASEALERAMSTLAATIFNSC